MSTQPTPAAPDADAIWTPDGHKRILNLQPSDPAKYGRYRAAAPIPVIPLDQIEPFDDWPSQVAIKDQDGAGACFPAGTRVRMEDGTERPIEAVRLLDRVLTAEGNVGRVVRTMVRDADDGLVRISLWGHGHLKATAEHPILTRRGYIPAGELKLDDWVRLPAYAPETKKFIHVADHLTTRVMTSRAGKGRRHFNAPEGRTQVDVTIATIPDAIEMTADAGRIFGLFLAEGRSDVSKVTWTFNKTEENTLVADLVGLLKSAWGVEAHLQHRPNNSINVVVYGTAWARLFESLCANGSGSKTLHADLTSAPKDFLRAMLVGWIAGDGHYRRGSTQGVTVSRNLALGMYDVAQALGYRPSIRRYEPKTYGAVASRLPRWEIDIPDARNDTYRCEGGEGCVWRKVKGIEREEFDGPVFNLEVEGDNSYVAEGVGVHNCNGHATATAVEFARAMAGMPAVPLSAWYVYGSLVHGRDFGSNITDALELIQTKGVSPESDVKYKDFSGRYSSQAESDAARFKCEIGGSHSTWEEIASFVALRGSQNLSVRATNGWSGRLDSNGCPPVGRGPGNHAVMVGGGIKRLPESKRAIPGILRGLTVELAIRMANSWGTQWGQDGFCWLTRAHIESGSWFECLYVRAVVHDPQDTLPVAS